MTARGLPVGAHVRARDPLGDAAEEGVDCVQFHVTNPQAWRAPRVRDDVAALRASPLPRYVHAPYLVNLASPDPVVRDRSLVLLGQVREVAAAIGAEAVVVHGGSTAGEPAAAGCARWADALRRLGDGVPLWVENTAGRTTLARTVEGFARLWEAVGYLGVGVVLDTCHAWAGGEALPDIADALRAATGRIDLVHANDSKDPAGSGRDRHEHLGRGALDPEALAETVRRAAAPVIVETRIEGRAADLAWLRDRLP